MSQEARTEAVRRATIQRLRADYDSEVLTQVDENIYRNRFVYGLSDAVTDLTTIPAYVGRREVTLGGLRAYPTTTITRAATGRDLTIVPETIGAGVFGRDHLKYAGDLTSAYYAVTFYPPTSMQMGPLSNVLLDPINHAGAFLQLEELRNEVPGIESLIALSRSIAWRYADRLARRLTELLDAIKEENSEELSISIESLNGFYEFIKANPNLVYPRLTLTPDGDIYTQWRESANKIFSAHFLSKGDVRFVIFKPNAKHAEKTVRLSGSTTVDTLIDEVRRHEATGWVLE